MSPNKDDKEDNEVTKLKTKLTVKPSLKMQAGGKEQDPDNLKEEVEGLKKSPLSPRQNRDNTIDLTDLLSDTDDEEEEEKEGDDQLRPSQKEEGEQEDKQVTVNQHAAAAKGCESQKKEFSGGLAPYAAKSKRVPITISEAVRANCITDQNEDRFGARSAAERRPMFTFGRPCGWSDFIERRKKKAFVQDPEGGIEEGTNDSTSPSDPSDPSNKATDHLQDQKVPASADKQNDGEKADTSPKSPLMTARPTTVHEGDTRTTSSEVLAKLPTVNSHKLASSSLDPAAPSSATHESSTANADFQESLLASLSSRHSALSKTLMSPSRQTGCNSRDPLDSKSLEDGIAESSEDFRGWSTSQLKRSLKRSQKFGLFNEKTEQMKHELQLRTDGKKSSVSSLSDTPSKVSNYKGTLFKVSLVGSRVAKEFEDGKTYFGTVASFSTVRRLWFVTYDDGDREEMDADEIASALELFKKNDKDLDMSWHANMSLDTRQRNLPSDEDVETPKEDLFSSIPDDAFTTLDSFDLQKQTNSTQGEACMDEDNSPLSDKTGNSVMDDKKSTVESSRRRKKFSFLGPSRFLKRKAGALYSNAAASLRKVGESGPGKHSGSDDNEECNLISSTDVEPPEKTQEDVYESYPNEDNVVGISNTSEKQSDETMETISPPPAKKTKTTTAPTTNLEVYPRAPDTEESPSSPSTGNGKFMKERFFVVLTYCQNHFISPHLSISSPYPTTVTPKVESEDETPAVATNIVVTVAQNTNIDSESVVLSENERNFSTDYDENDDNEIDSSKREEYEGQAVDDEVLRQEEEQQEEFGFISTEAHTLEPYTENELTVVEELAVEEVPKDGLADISIVTLAIAGSPLLVLAFIFWWTGMVEMSSSLLEALIRAPFQLALLGIGSQYPIAVAGFILTMFYLAAQEISARTMYTFDGQFYVALGALVLGVVTATAFAVALRIKPTRVWDAQYTLPLVSLLLTNSIASVVLSMDSICESTASYGFSEDPITGTIDTSLSTSLWTNAIHKGALPTMIMLQKVGTMNVPVMMAGWILGAGGGGEMKASVPVAAKYCLLILFLSGLCTFSTIFTTIGASVKILTVHGEGCLLRS